LRGIQTMADHTAVTFRWWLSHPEVFRHHEGTFFEQRLVGFGMLIVRLPLRILGLANAGSGGIAWCGTAVTGTCPTRLSAHIEETLRTAASNARRRLAGSPGRRCGSRHLSHAERGTQHTENQYDDY